LAPGGDDDHTNIQGSDKLWAAVKTAIVADLAMSIDNVIAIAGAATEAGGQHQLPLVIFGLLVSIPHHHLGQPTPGLKLDGPVSPSSSQLAACCLAGSPATHGTELTPARHRGCPRVRCSSTAARVAAIVAVLRSAWTTGNGERSAWPPEMLLLGVPDLAMQYHFCARTDTGRTRANNEDAVVFDAQTCSLVLADGMGGGDNAGEVASGMATATILQTLKTRVGLPGWQPLQGHEVRSAMHDSVNLADQAVYDAARANAQFAGTGTHRGAGRRFPRRYVVGRAHR